VSEGRPGGRGGGDGSVSTRARAAPRFRRPQASRFRWAIVGLLSAVAFVLYVDRGNITVAAPYLASEFRLTSQSLGRVLSAFLFGYAVGLVPGGWLADRFGPRSVLTAAGSSWAAITLLQGLIQKQIAGHAVNAVALLVTLRFLLGVCEACAYPTFNRALANWMRRGERARGSGLIHAASGLGGAFTPVWIALIITHFGWRQSFLWSSALTLAVILVWHRLATDEPVQHKRVSEPELILIAEEKEETHAKKPDLAWWRLLARSRNAYMLCASEFFFGVSGFVILTWLYIYFEQVRGAGKIYAAVLSSLPFVGMTIGAPLGGILCDYSFRKWGSPWGRRIVPLVAIVLSGVFGMMAPAIRNNTVSATVFSIAGALQFVAAPPFWATVIDITRRGTGIVGGFMNGSGALGTALGTIAFPWLVSYIGWEGAIAAASATAIIGGLLWLLIDSSRQIDQ
jgi:ACS family glucarate transporter-like MFS transporter